MHGHNSNFNQHSFSVLNPTNTDSFAQQDEVIQKSPIIELFSRVSSLMLTMDDFQSFAFVVLEDMGKTLNASRAQISKRTNGHFWSVMHEWTAPGITKEKKNLQRIDTHALVDDNIFSSIEKGEPYICNNVHKVGDPNLRRLLLSQGIQNFVTAPLFVEGNVLGLLCFDQCAHLEHWSEQHASTIVALSALISSAYIYFKSKAKLLDKREQIYRLFDVIPAPIYISTLEDYEILFQNSAIDELFGKDIGQKKCHEMYQDLQEPCPFCTNALLSKDGTAYVWHHHNAVVERDYKIIDSYITWQEKERCRFSLALDITENLIAQRTNVLEQEANINKGQFIANMSHELRTPLNGIVGLTHLAEQANDDNIVSGYLNKIKLSSDNLLAVINKTLDLSEIDGENLKLENRAFKLEDVVHGVQAILQGVVDAKGIGLEVSVDNKLPKVLMGDALRLSQIIINLSNNAIKFTTIGKVNITLKKLATPMEENTAKSVAHDDKRIWIGLCVEDTGIGIAEEKIATLFSEFSQAEASTTRRYGGTGLGLSIVKQFVDLMEGTLHVKSTLGKGSVFSCVLPFSLYEKISFDDRLLTDNTTLSPCDISNTKVLIVEDNEINVLIACEVLENFGCKAEVAVNGKIALDMLENNTYDIVIMDIQMPILDGLETAKILRKNHKYDTLPIIAMSAHAMVQDYEKSREAGMQEHISKPFDPENLRRTICKYVKGFCYER